MSQPSDAPVRRVRVFLLDDHEIVRRGLRDLLESDPAIEVVGEAGTAREARDGILLARPDVAILDGRLPDGSGVEVARDVRSADPFVRVLILTSYDDDEALFAAITAGASGYLLKQMRGDDLIEAVHRVAAGQSLLDPAVTARVLDRLRGGGRPDRIASLTDQERRILGHIAQGETNRQIAEALGVAEKTVKNHVSNLLGKLGLESRTQAAIFATRHSLPTPA
ncbi:DNA-binding NarL/FixJ family response regulator [Motilibacter peucedani]|uniref:DNA-binding NarL/FixJ family response regulator n=1 Tax=Motilibacter peucedani TaxID=598650 RepID=A0A420XTW4_9ACTN|nr:response regulator transcription factor [Motilibacter peucedani]RKS80197.1 DNA-binding NarL/FixJ family response regulator [Motilibacter peucedani]